MEMPAITIPDWLKNVCMYGVSGFAIGFLQGFIATQGQVIDLYTALLGAATLGLYSAAKEVLAYLESLMAGKTTASKGEASKKLTGRML
jgi:hypothetical protein